MILVLLIELLCCGGAQSNQNGQIRKGGSDFILFLFFLFCRSIQIDVSIHSAMFTSI